MRRSLLVVAVCLLALCAVSVHADGSVTEVDVPFEGDLMSLSQESESFLFESARVQQGSYVEGNSTSLQAWASYKQCGQSWSKDRLGTKVGSTICSAGCAMSSVAMIVKSRGKNYNPGTLNAWLRNHGGYVSGNLLVWGAVQSLGVKLSGYYRGRGSFSQSSLKAALKAGRGVVVNVRNGGHWVLVTGYVSGNTYRVNDPGYTLNSYQYGDMSNFVVYV